MAYINHKKEGVPALPLLPARAKQIVEQFESGSVLGASLTIRLISEIFRILANESKTISPEALSDEIQQTGDYFILTRGALSPAVGNAVRWMLHDLVSITQENSLEQIRNYINHRTKEYDCKSLEDVEKIAHYGANLLHLGQKVMAYDYSSSVNAVLRQSAVEGKKLTVVIPESRYLDGGIKILREMVPLGHDVLFTVDAAMGNELRTCEAVFVGVESLTANGGFWTTVGTRSLAILAKYYLVPFYVPTELIKIDVMSAQGLERTTKCEPIRIFEPIAELKDSKQISCFIDDLEFTPRELITSYITEDGVLPPEAIWTAIGKYLR
jgi:ribose 1,5-bisphosphate isomerase